MNKLIKKILILGGIFLIAAIAFLWMTRGSKEEQTIDYGVMEEASLPIVSMSAEGYAINTLYGYVNEMGASYVQESLTPLAADRRLPVTIETCGNEIRKIRYEIRSLDGEELVGKTAIAIVNLPPRKMMGIDSEGMLISAVHEVDGHEGLNLLMVDPHIPAGAKLY